MSSSGPIFSIGAVGRMLGVPTATLRAWEERYGVVVPERSAGGHRLYSRSEVEQLSFVREAIRAGSSAADAHRLISERSVVGGVSSVSPTRRHESLMVLLAERDPFAGEIAEYFLHTEGFEVYLALDASESRRLYEERVPAIVVLDLMISGGRGLGLCRWLADRGATIIAVSSVEQRDRALDAGAEVFLRKPLEPLQLVSAVRDLLGDSAIRASRNASVVR